MKKRWWGLPAVPASVIAVAICLAIGVVVVSSLPAPAQTQPTSTLMCQPNQIIGAGGTSGNTNSYTADAAGIITSVAANDIPALHKAGCVTVGVGPSTLLGRLLGANMNITTDQAIPWFVPNGQYYRITKFTVKNASVSLTTAAGGIYPAASKGGTAIVANSQAYSTLTSGTLAFDLTIATTPGETEYGPITATFVTPILSLTTGQGAAATADLFVYGDTGL